ncbi:hypothetical protein ACYG9Z_03625 [Mesorhizobium sp. RSR380A]|uniref:hypothetical protein n=1 Tax=Mesorhizobium sp. LNJC380A00 TaxID=1287264 RepID=UPI0003CEB617|nr:hypothetical protein [Mesorhizobium sp. LNJC380A00]ESY49579.1 hypothetical protein X746_06860 [Mesorhizobium sp. LNJC380A00]
MRSFADRLIGKSIKKIEIGEPGYGIVVSLSDDAGFAIYTEVTACLSDENARTIERVTISDEQVILHLADNDFVANSKNRGRFAVVEAFVYGDDEGMVVEN